MSDTVRPTTDPNQNGVDERQNGVVKTKTDPRQNYLRATVSARQKVLRRSKKKNKNKESDKNGTVGVNNNFEHYTEQICTFLSNTSVFLKKALRPRASRGGALLQRPKATTWQCPSFVNTSNE